MRKCLGKHSCTSSTFSIAVLNGTCSLHSLGVIFVVVRDAIKLNKIIIITILAKSKFHTCETIFFVKLHL